MTEDLHMAHTDAHDTPIYKISFFGSCKAALCEVWG